MHKNWDPSSLWDAVKGANESPMEGGEHVSLVPRSSEVDDNDLEMNGSNIAEETASCSMQGTEVEQTRTWCV